MEMERADEAVSMHVAGSACSQAVFTVFADELGLEPSVAHRISGGFGGGIGRMGLTCGAVTGGIMALSLALGATDSADQDSKLALYQVVAEYMERLKAFKGSIECRVLLEGVDLWTEEGRDMVKARQLSEKVCNSMIHKAVEEAERILNEKGRFGV